MRHLVSATVATLITAALLSACGPVGGSAPSLEISDLPLQYKEKSVGHLTLLEDCHGENVVQRYGKTVDQRAFSGDQPGDTIYFVVAKATNKDLYPQLRSQLDRCQPSTDVSSAGQVTLAATWTYKAVNGPTIADGSVWWERTLTLQSNSGVDLPDTGPTYGLLARKGSYVFQLTGPNRDALGKYAAAAAG